MRSVIGKHGEIWFYGKDEYVGKSLYNYGEFSGEECEKILSLADKNKLSLDIGANVGAIAQMFEFHQYPCAAFEPQPEIHNLLQKNFKGETHNCALGSTEGTAQMPRLRYGARYNYGGMSLNTRTELGSYPVPVKTLDSFNYNNVGFIKIDVEGWEEEVLRGALTTIATCKPIMYIEDDRSEKRASLRKYITSMGYSIEEHNTPLYRPNNFFGKAVNVWSPHNFLSFNLICRPL